MQRLSCGLHRILLLLGCSGVISSCLSIAVKQETALQSRKFENSVTKYLDFVTEFTARCMEFPFGDFEAELRSTVKLIKFI